jgi:fucose 4-O-acetylase-like acetyltransferase
MSDIASDRTQRPATTQAAAPAQRLASIDAAKGIGILLVVVGHVVSQQVPQGHDWYRTLKDAIYLFHMPFFLALSGYVLGLSARAWTADRRAFILERLDRLIVPFFAFGLIIIAGKSLFSLFLHVDNTQGSLLAYLDGLFVHTSRSPATSVWYLYAAFIYAVIFRLVIAPRPAILPILLAASLILPFLDIPNLFYADRVLKFLPFFLIGLWAGRHRDIVEELVRRSGWLALIAFALSIVLALRSETTLAVFVTAVLSLPALYWLAQVLADRGDRLFITLGAYSMAIYLLNTITIGVTKGVGFLFLKWDGNAFYLYFVALTLAGIVLPIIAKLVLDRIAPPLARYMR